MSLEAAADELQRRARPAGRKGPLDEEALHDAILREVEERWEHLEAMRAAGKARRCALFGRGGWGAASADAGRGAASAGAGGGARGAHPRGDCAAGGAAAEAGEHQGEAGRGLGCGATVMSGPTTANSIIDSHIDSSLSIRLAALVNNKISFIFV